MDPTRDNPIIRFSAFWWGIGAFLIFAILLLVIFAFNRTQPASLEDYAAERRYEIRAEIERAQELSLSPESIQAAMVTVGGQLTNSRPVAVEVPEQVVPGSATAMEMAGGAAADTSAVDAATGEADAPIDPAVMELGQAQFIVCGACHGPNGEGGPAGPPLANSEWVTGPVSNLILIQLRGLTGPITVNGVEYNFPAGMAPMAYQTDEQVAAVLTYIRNSFGHNASAVTPEQVAAMRGEVGKPPVTAAELIQP
jgi:mono/diheme cytochrome c family protein